MAEEIKKSNQPQQENQPEAQKAENVDNRLPYKPPTLRKHGKIHGATKAFLVPYPAFDGLGFPYEDLS